MKAFSAPAQQTGMDLAPPARPLRPLRSIALGGAWFFIAVSLVHLLAAVVVKWQEPSGAFKLYHTVVDGRSYDAPWLCYDGTVGLLLATLQAALVAAAAAATLLPWRRSLPLRRAGHVALLGWSGLWAADLVWLASIDGRPGTIAQAALLCLLLGCTGLRAATGWRGSGPARRVDGPSTMVRDEAFDRRLAAELNLQPPAPEARETPGDGDGALQIAACRGLEGARRAAARGAPAARAAIAWARGALRSARSGAAAGLRSAARLLDRGAAA